MAARNKRAERLWTRLIQSYGTRVADTFGAEMPAEWVESIEDLTDEQLEHGMKIVKRESPVHPPTLGQFVQGCVNMPVAQQRAIATLQEQLCEYAAQRLHGRLRDLEFSHPWTYVYREWWDATRPKGMEKCAECIGVSIECEDDTRFKITVAEMQADTAGYQRMLRAFRPGDLPTESQQRLFNELRQLPPAQGAAA